MESAVPVEKVTRYYEECSGSAKQKIMDFVSFLEQRSMVMICFTLSYIKCILIYILKII